MKLCSHNPCCVLESNLCAKVKLPTAAKAFHCFTNTKATAMLETAVDIHQSRSGYLVLTSKQAQKSRCHRANAIWYAPKQRLIQCFPGSAPLS